MYHFIAALIHNVARKKQQLICGLQKHFCCHEGQGKSESLISKYKFFYRSNKQNMILPLKAFKEVPKLFITFKSFDERRRKQEKHSLMKFYKII